MAQQNLGFFVQSVLQNTRRNPHKMLSIRHLIWHTYDFQESEFLDAVSRDISMFYTFVKKEKKIKKGRERAGNQLLVRDKFRAGEIHRSKRLLTRNRATGEKR